MASAAHPRGALRRRRGRPVLGRTRLTKTTEIGTAIRPLRSVTLPARADGSPSAQRRGVRPRLPVPPDPPPSAHPGLPATNRRRGGARTARACPAVRAGRAAACLLGRRRCQSRDARHGRDVTRDHEGRRVGRVTGRDGRLTDGGETTIVINDVRRPRRGNREQRLALTGCGLPCRATRSNRDFLLAITGIIAHKNQFRAKSGRREHSTPGYAFTITVGHNLLQSLRFCPNRGASADVIPAACDAPIA